MLSHGTASWLLGVVSDLKLYHPPPIATVPLGTGNDLPFLFGWISWFPCIVLLYFQFSTPNRSFYPLIILNPCKISFDFKLLMVHYQGKKNMDNHLSLLYIKARYIDLQTSLEKDNKSQPRACSNNQRIVDIC